MLRLKFSPFVVFLLFDHQTSLATDHVILGSTLVWMDACQIAIFHADIVEVASNGVIQKVTPSPLIWCDKTQIDNTSKYSCCNELHRVVSPSTNYPKVPFLLTSISSDGMTLSSTRYRDIFIRDKACNKMKS